MSQKTGRGRLCVFFVLGLGILLITAYVCQVFAKHETIDLSMDNIADVSVTWTPLNYRIANVSLESQASLGLGLILQNTTYILPAELPQIEAVGLITAKNGEFIGIVHSLLPNGPWIIQWATIVTMATLPQGSLVKIVDIQNIRGLSIWEERFEYFQMLYLILFAISICLICTSIAEALRD